MMRLGLFTLHSTAGVFNGVICLHVVDMLGIGDDMFESTMKELDRLVGFGSTKRQKLDDELSATECHEFRGINRCLQCVTKDLLYPFQFVLKVLQRSQGQSRLRELLRANQVIDEIKQHEDVTLTFRVLDLTSCGLIGVSDACLGGVDQFGYPTDQDSKTGEKPLASLGAGGKFDVLECDSRTIARVCRSSIAAETRVFGTARRLNAVLCGLFG